MKKPELSTATKALLESQKRFYMIDQTKTVDWYERVLDPIGISMDDGGISIYSHTKYTYPQAAIKGVTPEIREEKKVFPTISSIGDQIVDLLLQLEAQGYVASPSSLSSAH